MVIIKKLLNFKYLPALLLLIVVAGLVWVGYDYANQKQEIKDLEAKVSNHLNTIDSLQSYVSHQNFLIEKQKTKSNEDSVFCKKNIESLQKMILELKKDRDYWKDWAGKLETGEFCVEKYGIFKQKKRLVPCEK
jgi:peptidoglycan hydrolase CwlO-like protein